MATLTSTGINCSNGTLDGFYTGTTYNNTSYPIGSYLLFSNSTQVAVNTNFTNPVVNSNATSFIFPNGSLPYGTGTNTTIAGTWKARGNGGVEGGFSYYILLSQRVA